MSFFGPDHDDRVPRTASVMLVAGVALSVLVGRTHLQCRIPMLL